MNDELFMAFSRENSQKYYKLTQDIPHKVDKLVRYIDNSLEILYREYFKWKKKD